MTKKEKTIVSEGVPLYLVDKIGTFTGIKKEKPVQEKVEEPVKEVKKQDFIKETKNILITSQKKDELKKEIPDREPGDVTDFIVPYKVDESEELITVTDRDGTKRYTFFVNIFPDSGTLTPDIHQYLTQKDYIFQVYNFVYPLEQSKVINDLKKKDKSYKQAIYERSKKDIDVLDLAYDANELTNLREAIKMGHLKLIDIGLIVQFFLSEEDIKKNVRAQILSDLKSLDFSVNTLRFLQKRFFENIHISSFKWEIYRNQIISTFQVDNRNLSYFNLFGRTGYEKSNGIYIGNDYESKNMVFRDIWAGSNYNFISAGKSGGGKSYATKTLLTREYSLDTIIYIIDPENEFTELTEAIGGEIIDTRKEENKINPFDFTYIHSISPESFKGLSKEEVIEKAEEMKQEFIFLISGLENLIKLIVRKEGGENTNNYVINHALIGYYESLGVKLENPATYFALKKNIANFKGFYDRVLEEESSLSGNERIVSNFIRKYAIGTGKELFANGKSNLSMKNKWTCFKFKDMADEIKDIMIFLVARFLVSAMLDPRVRHINKRLAIDEAHLFFNDIEIADYFLQILKRGRKFRFGLGLITQTIDDFFKEFKSEKVSKMIGNDIINNVGFALLLGQKGGTIERLRQTLSLGDNEIDFIKSISGGTNRGVGLLITEDKSMRNITKIQIEAEDFLRKIIG